MCRNIKLTSAKAAGVLMGLLITQGVHAEDETTLPADVVARRDLVYSTHDSGPVKLDLFTPPGPGPFPVVIWIHGGAWKMGDKAAWPHMNFLVGQGFAVANVGYRFSQVAKYPAQLDDVSAALTFLAGRAEAFKLDAKRVAATGESAGGTLAALLGLTAKAPAPRVRAVIELFGPTDLPTLHAPDANGSVEQWIGGLPGDKPDAFRQASPLTHVSPTAPPFLVLHGTKDALVPIDQSERFVAALKAAGVPAELIKIEDAPHAGPAFWTEPMRQTMLAFLKANLK